MTKFLGKIIFTLSMLVIANISLADPVWIDVRTPEEYLEDNIKGDLNIPMANLSPESISELFGKNAEINLYCRSGNRAGKAADMLTEAGFTNVHNVGGIDDVRELKAEALQSASH